MALTSIDFLFLFFPLSVLLYYLIRNTWRNYFLLAASLVFYSLGQLDMIVVLLLTIVVNYIFGNLLAKKWNKKGIKQIVLFVILIWNLGLLFYYKYYVSVFGAICNIFGISGGIPQIVLPIGISFFTFRTLSYCLDVYWGTVLAEKNFMKVALYISFFPQLTMGPISKYNDFSKQLDSRQFNIDLFFDGIQRIICGMGKKLIIADGVGSMVDSIFSMNDVERTVVMAWVGIGGYLIQLYFDFSGYSDMAIGIGQMFGFRTLENFNFPYISQSVTEYWSRWHITLGTWIKNYLYTPIFRFLQEKNYSINKCDILALLGAWLFTGIWHGTGVKFVLWGMYWYIFIITERQIEHYLKKRRKRLKLKKRQKTLRENLIAHVYFIIVLIFGQLLFRSSSVTSFCLYVKSMFGFLGNEFIDMQTLYLGKQNVILLILGGVLCFPVLNYIKKIMQKHRLEKMMGWLKTIGYSILMLVDISFAMANTYDAFIYFQF